jgi:predicted transposase YbfD/YdcC
VGDGSSTEQRNSEEERTEACHKTRRPFCAKSSSVHSRLVTTTTGHYFFRTAAQWTFSLERCKKDTRFETAEVRSGELWPRDVETRPATPELSNDFPGAKQFVRCTRTVVRKDTGEIRFQETEYAVTSCLAPAEVLYKHWRGHWEIENGSHHKRDTIWREDACRTRNAAQAFAALRNLVLGLFHLNGYKQVLRQTRRCNAQPQG